MPINIIPVVYSKRLHQNKFINNFKIDGSREELIPLRGYKANALLACCLSEDGSMERFKNIVATFKRSLNDLLDKVNLVKQIRELRDQVTDLSVQLNDLQDQKVTAMDVASEIEMSDVAENLDINYRKLASFIEIDYSELIEEFDDMATEVAEKISTEDIADNFSASDIAEKISVDYVELASEVDIENVAKEVIRLLIKNYQKQPQV